MAYHLAQDRFYYLLDDLVEQGGVHMQDKACSPEKIDYGKQQDPGLTHGCRKTYLVGIPYDGIEQKEGLPVKHDGLAVVCAEGDGIEWWPRFQPESM